MSSVIFVQNLRTDSPTFPTTVMYALRILPRRANVRSFHSPFVVNHLSTPHPTTVALVYEKQHDCSPEPHMSSSGTRTYVVSEPDPSNAPYQVPYGAYPASPPYLSTALNPEGSHSPTNSYSARALLHKEAGIGQSAGVRNFPASGDIGYGASGIGLMDGPSTKSSKF